MNEVRKLGDDVSDVTGCHLHVLHSYGLLIGKPWAEEILLKVDLRFVTKEVDTLYCSEWFVSFEFEEACVECVQDERLKSWKL